MNRLATTLGLFPLPDWAKTELIDLKGKQRHDLIHGDEGPEITAVYEEARSEVLRLQDECGLDRIVEGQLRWDDMLAHPLAVHESVDTGGLVRYYDNNNFYRESTITGDLTPDGDIPRELESAAAEVSSDALQGVFPAPYSLSQLATNEYYESEDALIDAIGEFLAGELSACPSLATLVLLDPSLGVDPPERVDPLVSATEQVVTAAHENGIEDIVLQTYWDVPPAVAIEALLEIDGLGLGFDLVNGAADVEERLAETGVPGTLSLGVVDGQNTRMESPEEIERAIESITASASGIDRLYVTPNTELFYLPTNRAAEKMELLGDIATEEVFA